jgi:hypothetical protein
VARLGRRQPNTSSGTVRPSNVLLVRAQAPVTGPYLVPGASNHTTGDATTRNVAVTCAVGDLLLCIHGNDFHTLADMTTPTATGQTFTEVINARADSGTNGAHLKAWTTVAAATSVTVTFSQALSNDMFCAVIPIRDDAGSPVVVDDSANGTGAAQTSHVAPSVDPATNTDDLAVWVWLHVNSSATYTLPGGVTELYQEGDAVATFARIAVATEKLGSAAATGTRTATTSSTTYASQSIAISSPSGAAVLSRTAADTAAATDAATRAALAATRTAADTAAATDAVVRTSTTARTASDAAATSDTAAGSLSKAGTATDAASAVDTATRTSSRTRAATDTAAASDTATRSTVRTRAAADTAQAVDTAAGTVQQPGNLQRTASDTAAAADVATRAAQVFARTTTEAVATVDTAVRVVGRFRIAVDATTTGDTAAGALVRSRTATDATVTTDAAVRTSQLFVRTATDTASAVDVAEALSAAGITVRPFTTVTSRPTAGITVRPYTGTTARP